MVPDEPLTDPPKCARCSAPILDGELILRDHGDWLHVRCRVVIRSSEQVRQSKALDSQSRKLIGTGKERIEESHGLRLLGIVERVSATAQRQAYCFPCLAMQLRVAESHLRSAAQILVVRGAFMRARRECYSCGRMDDVLVPR